jgi:hypothetical protein
MTKAECESKVAIQQIRKMDDIDHLTALLHDTRIDSTIEREYETAFEKIVRFAKEHRRDTISVHEHEVTKALAEPFTQGGPLVILLEPRHKHPWKDGVDTVVRDCKSLQALDEGFKVISEGLLSLTTGVFVLDLRPFLNKKYHPQLGSEVWESLYDLVYKAIEAKKPDVLLCMGQVREIFLSINSLSTC